MCNPHSELIENNEKKINVNVEYLLLVMHIYVEKSDIRAADCISLYFQLSFRVNVVQYKVFATCICTAINVNVRKRILCMAGTIIHTL